MGTDGYDGGTGDEGAPTTTGADETRADGVRANGIGIDDVRVETVSIESEGRRLAGSLHLPPGAPRRAIALHGATGVPQGYYGPLARWLATHRDAAVLTYDYRDFGRSATGPLRDSTASMADWGVTDQGAALDLVCERFPRLPIEVVGHSLGAQYLPWHARAGRVERLVALCSGPAHWLAHPPRFLPRVVFFWFLGGPLAVALAGYLPGRLLGLGADLPRNVYRQWRRWCLSRGFNRRDWGTTLPEPDLGAFRGELVLVAVADDDFVPPARVARLAATYPAAVRVRRVEVRPAELGLARIGHAKLASARCAGAWPGLFDASG